VRAGLFIEERTWAAACEHVAGLADIAWERKRDELVKILLSDARYPVLTENLPNAVLRGLTLLYEMGAFPYLIPELLEGDGIAQRRNTTRTTCCGTTSTPAPQRSDRYASPCGLLHDVGKPAACARRGCPSTRAGTRRRPQGFCRTA
jgi:tRNA nucleotidyltransferase/poly(A) polymerase